MHFVLSQLRPQNWHRRSTVKVIQLATRNSYELYAGKVCFSILSLLHPERLLKDSVNFLYDFMNGKLSSPYLPTIQKIFWKTFENENFMTLDFLDFEWYSKNPARIQTNNFLCLHEVLFYEEISSYRWILQSKFRSKRKENCFELWFENTKGVMSCGRFFIFRVEALAWIEANVQ